MFLRRLLSNDMPRSRLLALLLVALFIALAFAPFIFPGVKALSVAAKILVFVVLVASFDLLLGYTGIVSFAHTMFFGIGAYGVAIAATRIGPSWPSVGLGVVCALAVSLLLSLVIGLFSLRVRAIFFAMVVRSNDSPATRASTKSTRPMGGCSRPIIRLSTITRPKWIGSTPSWTAMGSRIGTRIVIAAVGSRKQPTNSISRLASSRNTHASCAAAKSCR